MLKSWLHIYWDWSIYSTSCSKLLSVDQNYCWLILVIGLFTGHQQAHFFMHFLPFMVVCSHGIFSLIFQTISSSLPCHSPLSCCLLTSCFLYLLTPALMPEIRECLIHYKHAHYVLVEKLGLGSSQNTQVNWTFQELLVDMTN